jgi:orc1/cdc6 family replication initiation protein
MNQSLIENPAPLQSNYVPPEFVARKREARNLSKVLDGVSDVDAQNLVVEGPRGTGKSHLVLKQLHQLPDAVNTCYVPCHRFDTECRALKQIYQSLFDEELSDGHHTTSVQRKLEEHTVSETVVVLDELDFLLQNDGNSLLYYLTRNWNQEFTLMLIKTGYTNLKAQLEERTYSSLYPQNLQFDPYSDEEIFDILAQRARKALAPKSLQREALTRIASSVENVKLGLTWLRTAAQTSRDTITGSVVRDEAEKTYQRYADELLADFSIHHQLIYQAIRELAVEQETPIQTGEIYSRYRDLCEVYDEEALSNRRISDFLKHLEILELITADYKYGGSSGKTRLIQPTSIESP